MSKEKLDNKTLDNAISAYKTVVKCAGYIDDEDYSPISDKATLSFLQELKQYRDLEEQGLLLRLPISVSELVDKLFSHNETIALWEKRKDEISYHYLLWKGMAWDIPKEYAKCKFVKIFGIIPEKFKNADVINIEIMQSEAEEKLRELEGK